MSRWNNEGREQENWDYSARTERDAEREPFRRAPRPLNAGQAQPPVKGGGR